MDCVNVRLNGQMIRFDCPNCGVDAEINESTYNEIWDNFEGVVSCPLPQGCNSQIKIPAKEVINRLRNQSAAISGGGINDIIDRMKDSDKDTEEDEEKTEEKIAPTGPFRYESQSEEASAWAEDFENKKSAKAHKPTTSPLAIRTFRNKECIVQGQNRFDETVSAFLGNVGKDNIICVSPINYTDPQDKSPDYGIVVYYQNSNKEAPDSKQAEAAPAPEPVVWRD